MPSTEVLGPLILSELQNKRRREDSNLWFTRVNNGFQDRRIRPLCHSSVKPWLNNLGNGSIEQAAGGGAVNGYRAIPAAA